VGDAGGSRGRAGNAIRGSMKKGPAWGPFRPMAARRYFTAKAFFPAEAPFRKISTS